eukprot:6462403-Amphidinium_carterae.1
MATLSAHRQAALVKWVEILAASPLHSTLGRSVVSDSGDQWLVNVRTSLARKATGTIVKRATDFIRVFQFLCQDKLAPSAGLSTIQALSFAGGVFGLDGALASAASTRVRGRVHELLQGKRLLKQAPPLTVQEVSILEAAVRHDPRLSVRVLAGFLLFMVFGRVRAADLHRSHSIYFDFDHTGLLNAQVY